MSAAKEKSNLWILLVDDEDIVLDVGAQMLEKIGYNVFNPTTLRPDNLIDRLIAGNNDTRAIGKGVCAAMLGSAITMIQ